LAKKVRGKIHYFRTRDDPIAAEKLWDATKHQLKHGKVGRVSRRDSTLNTTCNQFLTSKQRSVKAGELSSSQLDDLHRVCEHTMSPFGKDRLIENILPQDFRSLNGRLVKRYKSLSSLRREMTNVGSIFNFALRNDLTENTSRLGTTSSRRARKPSRIAATNKA